MNYKGMPIKHASPEQMAYNKVKFTLTQISVSDAVPEIQFQCNISIRSERNKSCNFAPSNSNNKFKPRKMEIETLIKQNRGTIVDVRSPEEFRGGHVAGSVNIPIQEIVDRIEEVKNLKTPLILCCASGGRSGQVHAYLVQQGMECHNAGSWMDVNYYQSQKTI